MNNKYNFNLSSLSDNLEAGVSIKTLRDIVNAGSELGLDLPLINPDLVKNDEKFLIDKIAECIKAEGGEVAERTRIINLAMIYIHLSDKGKRRFFRILARNFQVDKALVDKCIDDYLSAGDEKSILDAEIALSNSLIPLRIKLLKQFITLPNGFIFLKDMRRDLLPVINSDIYLQKLSDDIKRYLINFFDVNVLDLKEISWNSPAILLESLIKNEAVHEIKSWTDLKHRLEQRKVYGFFHNKMPNEPIIFISVAFVKGLTDNIQKIINVNIKPEDPNKADTAIFYSISNTQKGLAGISFGNFLIKRVVKKLSAEFPDIKVYATLSPIPDFMEWLSAYLKQGGDNFFKQDEKECICALSGNEDESSGMLDILNSKKWFKNDEIAAALKRPLLRLCTYYLVNVKRPGSIKAYDPVANFHLSNGAKIEQINWLADLSKHGIINSAGIMVNYHYRLDKININHEAYMKEGKIHASGAVRSWLT